MAPMTDEGSIIDLRDLEAPGPLLRILGDIEAAPGGRFVFLLARDPAPLYALLAQAGWRHDLRREERGFSLTVYRGEPGP